MEIIQVWALAGALGLAALAATLKAVEYRHELKLADKEISRLGKEMDILKDETNKRVADLEKLKAAEIEKLTDRIHQSDSLKPNAVNPQGVPYHSAAPRIADGADPDPFGF